MPRRSPDPTTPPPAVPGVGVAGPGVAGSAVRRLPDGAPPLLLRVPVGSPRWAEDVPPLPAGAQVTVAFSDADVEAEHGDALALLGYRSVGVRAGRPGEAPSVDVLIPRAEADRWPLWRDQLLDAGGRVWDLALGPVAMLLAGAVAVHRPPST